jgi:hypothetical protein
MIGQQLSQGPAEDNEVSEELATMEDTLDPTALDLSDSENADADPQASQVLNQACTVSAWMGSVVNPVRS